MAIRRVTFEIDDLQDSRRATASPPSLTGSKAIEIRAEAGTGTPQTQPDYGEDKDAAPAKVAGGAEVVGRTLSDLFVTFINEPHVMVTLFVVVSFAISIGKIDGVRDFGLPLGMSALFTCVWFIAGWIIKRYRK